MIVNKIVEFSLICLLCLACTHQKRDKLSVVCEVGTPPETYTIGELPCLREEVVISSKEKLQVRFIVTDKSADDPYDYGYQELVRYRNGSISERIKLRNEDDAYWTEVPFVRIRNKKYLADLDGDGFLEFALFPFHPGSSIWGTVRIYSLKEKIEFWGEGRYQFEGDSFVQLNCTGCSKLNPEECKKCE